MSDGITDANRMTLHDIEIWRQRTKEEFVSKLTTKELVEELCKREGIEIIDVPDERKWYTTVTDECGFGIEAGHGWGEATILVVKK